MRPPTWVIGLFLATLALGTDEFVIVGVLSSIAADLRVSTGQAGQLVTVFALAFALGAPVLAVALEPVSRRRTLGGGLLVFAVVNALAAAAPTLWALATLRVIAGLAAAAVSSTAFAAAAEGAPEGRAGRHLSMATAGLTTALFTGVPLGAWIGGRWGWRATFLVIAAVAIVALAIVATSMPYLPGAPRQALAVRLAPLRRMAVARLVAAVFLCGAGGLMFYTYLSPILAGAGMPGRFLPLVLLEVGLIGVPSALLGGWLADRFGGRGGRLIVIGGHALVLAGVAALVWAGASWPSLVLVIGVWSVFAWALNPPLQASTMQAAPEAPMAAVALNISGLYLGTAAAAVIGGALADGLGVRWIPGVAALLLSAAWVSAYPRSGPGVLHAPR